MTHSFRFNLVGKLVMLAACCAWSQFSLADSVHCAEAPRALLERSATSTLNHCPTARAGLDALAVLDQPLTLNASKSTDMDGDRLHYQWRVLKAPTGSGAMIAVPDAVRTQFTPDLLGDYVLELVVEDARGALARDTLTISTTRTAPVANAGIDVTSAVGSVVNLDGIGSFDVDGSTLDYQWQLIEKPIASQASLGEKRQARTGLYLDVDGDYVVQLVVTDGDSSSVADTVRISTHNTRPTAHAGRPRTLAPGSTLHLDGRASRDFDQHDLGFEWSLLSAPDGVAVEINGTDQPQPSAYLVENGLYVFQLATHDGELLSQPDTVLIEVDNQRIRVNPDDYRHLTRRGGGDDEDGDGVADPDDNCVLVANSDQRDTDGDGIGNRCDPDLNNDGVVNVVDLGILRSVFFTADPDADFNGDGVVNVVDLGVLRSRFFLPPGPAGTIIWISLVDGDFANRLNWQPAIVPSAGALALIDVEPAVTVTATADTIVVKGLVNNETLRLTAGGSFTATDALENGGALVVNGVAINETQVIPSQAGSGTVDVTAGSTWRDVTLGVDTSIQNGVNINISDGLTINAITDIIAPTSNTGFVVTASMTVDGTGTLRFSGVGNGAINEPRLFPLNGTILTIDPGLTLSGGKGTIGGAGANLVMNGTVLADVGGEALRFASNLMTGTGSATARNGGAIEFLVNFDNGGATFNLDGADGAIRFLNSSAMRNGTMTMAPGTNVELPSGAVTFQNQVFNGDLTIQNGVTVNTVDGLTLNGGVQINAPTSNTGFVFNNTQTLGGNAIITINGVGNGAINEPRLFPINGTTLTVAPTVTVRGGKGTVGNAGAILDFQGVLEANVDGEQLAIGGSTWSATNSMSATNNGSIRFFGILNNGGQALDLDTADGELRLTTGGQINSTTLNGTAGSTVIVPIGSQTWTSNVMNIDVEIQNAANINVASGLTQNGDVRIVAPTSPTGMIFTNSQTLDGTGTITIDGTGNGAVTEPRLFPVNGTVLTIGENITVRGNNGTIGQLGATLNFDGNLISDEPGQFLDIGGAQWTASQTLRSTGGGIEMFGILNNEGGAFAIDNPTGPTQLRTGSTLRNATINGTAGTNIEMQGSTNLDNMVINADTTHNNASNSNVANGLTINGTAAINAPISPTGFLFTNSQSLLGNLTIVIDSVNNGAISEPRLFPVNGTTLTVGPNVRIEGGDATIGQAGAAINLGGATIDANVPGKTLRIAGAWTSTGTLRASNGGDIELSGTLDNGSASITLDVADGSAALLNGSSLRNATINGTPGSVMTTSVSGTFQNLVYAGDLVIPNASNITVTDGLTLNGNVTINAPVSPTGFLFSNTQTLAGTATIEINGAGNGSISEPRLFPINGTTLTIGPNIAIRGGVGTVGQLGATTIVQGSITADTGRLVASSIGASPLGTFAARNGNTLTVTGSLTTPGTLLAESSSLIDISAALSMSASTVTSLEVNSDLTAGRIEASTVTHDGTLNMSAVDGYAPTGGESFGITEADLISGGSGAFATVNSFGLGGGQSFAVTYDGDGNAIATVN